MKTLSGFFAVLLAASGSPSLASDLTGNWAVKEALGDGTVRATYLNLKQEGAHITGAIRATQFYYRIVERSEEHTSELQSHSDLVCRLLLEKKKKKKKRNTNAKNEYYRKKIIR